MSEELSKEKGPTDTMTLYTTLSRTTRYTLLACALLIAVAISARAEHAPDSINTIQDLLPDSANLSGKVVYVDFWASWCPPCRNSFPWMQELYEKYHHLGLEIVAISVDKDHQSALNFLSETKPSFPVLFDSTSVLAKQYGLEAMPTSYVYGPDGHLAFQHVGFLPDDAEELDHDIFKLLYKEKSK